MKILRPKPFYFDSGSSAVLLLHSFSGTSNDMRLLGRFLERNGYTAYAPMLVGHGTSEPLDILQEGSPQAWWQQTKSAIDFLKQENKTKIYVFGLSLGAIFATQAIEELDDVVCGGVFGSPLYNKEFNNIRNAFMTYAKKVYSVQQGLTDIEIDSKLRIVDSKIDSFLMEIRKASVNVTDNLAEIKRPYFIGQGTSDKLVDPNAATEVAKDVKTSQLHLYNAGHVLTINNAHNQLQSDVLNFLENN
ncbi:alpha/beta hydrolase [Companilactobacillus halodurans]|uniref:Carboxylesterase n=1 Tax=Companilactobacillus halodurans TaxID=2584183 RepID=A0A5P0ZY88_9LACO|nr:alpha/beta fold hydrolase [Companilactobacillus halodurans]MQS75798.1 carboxylesterase [Companilactobacillus halodurans]MQS97990.1 carboxylesterase [Companilactobacillus halodurans]